AKSATMIVSRSVRSGAGDEDEQDAAANATAAVRTLNVRWRLMRHESYHRLLRRNVALARAHGQILVRDAHQDGVDLAVPDRRSEREPVLPVQLFGDAREPVREVRRILELQVGPAGFLGQLPQARIRGRNLGLAVVALLQDRKSTRLNSSHSQISYAVFCLKKKTITPNPPTYTHSLFLC